MSLRARLFGVLALALLALALLAELLSWQSLRHARAQQAALLLQIQRQAWTQWDAEQMETLQRLGAQLAAGPSHDLAARMRALAQSRPGLRIDLWDGHERLLASTAYAAEPEPLRDMRAGLQALSAREYRWLHAQRAGTQMLVLGQDASTDLHALAQRLGGRIHLLNLRGNPTAPSLTDPHFFDAVVIAQRTPQVQTLADAALQLVSQPLTRADGQAIGTLVWTRTLSDAAHDLPWRLQIAAQILAALVFALAALWLWLRHALDPLARNIGMLQSLAQGDTDVALHAGDEDAEDEAGSVARGVLQLRAELLSLETLRQERVRTRRQQERLIRDQLRSLADSLEPASREEILQALGAAGTPAPAEAPNSLADLAGILGRMSGLVSTQQSRLLQLLREVQASVQTQAILASLQQELEIAREMQQSILPRQTPDRREVEIAAMMIPAQEIGGDFYDYFTIDDDHLALVIADVSGKGVPAAFFMAISRTLLKSNGLFLRTPGATIAALNDQLCDENDQMMFVTVFYAVLELSTGRLTYVNAGHNPPLLLQRGGAAFFPKGRNMGLAVLEGQHYHEGTLQLCAGDSLLLYTDGVTEACNAQGALFGDARLLRIAQSFAARPDRRGPARQLTEHIVDAVRHFEAGAAQADDITVVALTYRGSAPPLPSIPPETP